MRSIDKWFVVAAFAVAILGAVPVAAHAQLGVHAVAGVWGFSGDDLDDLDAGFGVDGGISVRPSDQFSIGGGFHWSSHGVAESTDDVTMIQVVATPVIHLGAPGETDVFFGARGGWARLSDNDEDLTGVVVGPLAGVGFPLGGRVSAGVGGTFSLLSLTDDVSGSSWGVGAFIGIGLGG
jgi:hypothetical protein